MCCDDMDLHLPLTGWGLLCDPGQYGFNRALWLFSGWSPGACLGPGHNLSSSYLQILVPCQTQLRLHSECLLHNFHSKKLKILHTLTVLLQVPMTSTPRKQRIMEDLLKIQRMSVFTKHASCLLWSWHKYKFLSCVSFSLHICKWETVFGFNPICVL